MLRFALKISLLFIVLGTLSGAGLALYLIPKLPDIETLKDVRMQTPLRVYSADGALISEYGEKRRTPVKISDVPEHFIEAFLAAEDDRFYSHPGVDWQGILRAAINLIKTGKKSQGGSTITMQVARNFFLSREKSYLRKINEIFLALKIERELSKDEILELYLNKIYLGQRAYGIGAAAQVYYGIDIKSLTLAQMAMIAGLPKAPSTTNPVTDPRKAAIRRNYVLGRMLIKKFITQQEFDAASRAPISASLHSPAIEIEAPYVAEMVRTELVKRYGDDVYNDGYKVYTTIHDKYQTVANKALRDGLIDYDKRHGYRGPEHHFELAGDEDEEAWKKLLDTFPVIGDLHPALIVAVNDDTATAYLNDVGKIEITGADYEWASKYLSEIYRGPKPEKATDVFKAGDVIRMFETTDGAWKFTQIPEVEGGLVSMDPNNGRLLALVGGFDFQRSKFNRVTQAKRQPGSSFKPFVYSAALNAGFTAASIINDAPVVIDDPGIEEIWRPENYNKKSRGPTRLREAITYSLNLVSIRLLNEVGVTRALKHIAKFGFDTEELPHNLSLALGSGGVSPWELATAYCVLANGGYKVDPFYIDHIVDYNGKTVFQAHPLTVCRNCDQAQNGGAALDTPVNGAPKEDDPTTVNAMQDKVSGEPVPRYAPRVVDGENVWIIDSMTRDVIQHGTGRRALVLKRPDLSGKTGTTNDQRDAWFAGYNPDIVTVSWVGFDDFRQLGSGETGSRAALPMWIDYMREVLKDIPEKILERPPGLISIRIDPKTGRPTGADTPGAFFEVFRPKYAPKPDAALEDQGEKQNPLKGDHPEELF